MDFLTCQFCNQQFFSYECHICKYEDCIPSIMNVTNECDFQTPLQDNCKIQELSSSPSESGNPPISYCLYEETSILQDEATLPIDPDYMNDETACNLITLESNKTTDPNDTDISHPASSNYNSELSHQKANIPCIYQQINDNFTHNVETQINLTTKQNCCEGSDASGYIELATKVSELPYEELPRNNSFAVHQHITTKKENACIKALREPTINASSVDIQLISPGNSKLSKKLCNDSIDLRLKKKFNEHSAIHSDNESFHGDIYLGEFIHGSTCNKEIHTEDESIAVANASLTIPFKGKEINDKKYDYADCETTANDQSKSLNDKHMCSECGQQFINKTRLKCHLITHKEERPFICGYCHFGFKRKADLKKHIHNHTGKKPFGCSLCKKKFLQKCVLQTHGITRKPFCSECRKILSNEKNFSSH